MVQMEKRTSWRAVLSLILGASFFLSVLVIGLITPFDALSRIGSFGELFRWPLLWEFCLGTLRGGRLGEGRIGGFRLAIAGLFLAYLGIAFRASRGSRARHSTARLLTLPD